MKNIEIKCWLFNPCRTSCYVVSDRQTGECVVIDPCAYSDEERAKLLHYINKKKLHPCHVLLTHIHFDHVLSTDLFANQFSLYPEAHVDDKPLLPLLGPRIEEVFGKGVFKKQIAMPKTWLRDDDEIRFGGSILKIIHTPGHTPGSVFYYCEAAGVAFSGDTLFYHDIGRTDLPYGSLENLRASLEYITQCLPNETKIYSGHDTEPTTIGRERQYLRDSMTL